MQTGKGKKVQAFYSPLVGINEPFVLHGRFLRIHIKAGMVTIRTGMVTAE